MFSDGEWENLKSEEPPGTEDKDVDASADLLASWE